MEVFLGNPPNLSTGVAQVISYADYASSLQRFRAMLEIVICSHDQRV